MSTSAEQFALMGAVFLVLGAAFVFAPQIVSAVNGFLAAVFGRGKKPSTTPDAKSAAPQPVAPQPAPREAYREAYLEPSPSAEEAEVWGPAGPSQSGSVARLREEIGSSWTRRDEDRGEVP